LDVLIEFDEELNCGRYLGPDDDELLYDGP
jgi:hypothetical protein